MGIFGYSFSKLFIFVLILWSSNAAKNPAEKRLSKLIERSNNGGTLMEFNNLDYKQFNKRFPRDYGLVLLLTARDSRYNCRFCKSLEKHLRDVAEAYRNSKVLYPNAKPLFFAVVDVDKARDVFSSNKIRAVPILTYQPPTQTSLDEELNNINEHANSINDIMEFVNKHHHIKIPKLLETRRGIFFGGAVAIVAALVGIIVVENFESIKKLPWNHNVWFIVTIMVYIFGAGGMVYCVINDTESHIYKPKGAYMFLHPQGRSQFVLEGVIVGAIYLLCAASLVFMYKNTTKRVNENDSEPTRLKRVFHAGATLIRMSFLLSLFIYSFTMLLNLYTTKNSWYHFWNLLPSNLKYFIEGPISGNSFVSWTRRLFKLSRYFINDYVSWDLLKAKSIRLLKLKKIFG